MVLRQAQNKRSFDVAQDERVTSDGRGLRPGRRDRVWTEALGEAFLERVRETGNARAAARALGHKELFNNRMRRNPAFRRQVRAAAAEADARLRGAESAFPEPFGIKGKLPTDPEALGGYLRPGRKPACEPEPVLRRNSQGRMQVTMTREGHWTSRIEADFLARLAATGNFDACALAVGFQPASVHERVRKWAAFARECERALAEADVALSYRLTAHAHALLRPPGEAEAAGIEEAEVPFDPALTMRAGAKPQVLVTTTPRPVEALRAVLRSPGLALTRGTSFDNPHNASAFLRWADSVHRGTRLGRQELLGELLEDVPGALWPLALIEASREQGPLDRSGLKRVLIGVDPPLTADGDECGIVACGLGRDGIARVLGDHSAGGLSPEQWARKVAGAVEAWAADRVVAEGNSGGEMVDAVLRGAGHRFAVRRVFAKSGKARRAEPIAAFFESGEAKLAGHFPELEKQLAGLVIGGDYQGPGRSPDRADAMVWAMTELLLEPAAAEPRITRL